MEDKNKGKSVSVTGIDYGKAWRDVDFYLRLHGHLPDFFCGEAIPFGKCNYREDGKPINVANDYVEKLRQDPEYRKKEKEVKEAVNKKWEENKTL